MGEVKKKIFGNSKGVSPERWHQKFWAEAGFADKNAESALAFFVLTRLACSEKNTKQSRHSCIAPTVSALFCFWIEKKFDRKLTLNYLVLFWPLILKSGIASFKIRNNGFRRFDLFLEFFNNCKIVEKMHGNQYLWMEFFNKIFSGFVKRIP